MLDNVTKKEITDYFRSNIFEALSSYNSWKMLSHSKSTAVVAEDMAHRYVEIQNYHPHFFITAERAFMVHFVVTTLHPFDNRDDSYSLYKIGRTKTEEFVRNNESVIDALRKVRNKLFAHRDSNITPETNFVIPSVINLNNFFDNLIKLYNEITGPVDGSFTVFENADEVKRDIELLLMNLYRGESMRKKDIDIEWMWEKDDKKASNIV
jgi:hypothetical protein